jgi:hypothetical protein
MKFSTAFVLAATAFASALASQTPQPDNIEPGISSATAQRSETPFPVELLPRQLRGFRGIPGSNRPGSKRDVSESGEEDASQAVGELTARQLRGFRGIPGNSRSGGK